MLSGSLVQTSSSKVRIAKAIRIVGKIVVWLLTVSVAPAVTSCASLAARSSSPENAKGPKRAGRRPMTRRLVTNAVEGSDARSRDAGKHEHSRKHDDLVGPMQRWL